VTATAQTLVGLVMAVGVIGVVVPLLPGLLLIWAAGLWWTVADGGGPARWTVLATLTVLLVAGTITKYVLPARFAAARGAPATTLLAGAAGAVIGFFVLPLVGLVVGGVAGIYLAELGRLGDAQRAWTATRAALAAIGLGVLVELSAALAMVLTWLVGLLVT
jgi:uncharacterized protein YqgC (DUF456 family)